MSYTVLLVDDDPAVLRGVGRYLDRVGHEVLEEDTGRGAVAVFEERRPEVVVLDLVLPDTHGLQVLERLRALGASVVLLTGHGDIETAVKAMEMGAEGFLTKPVELEHLGAVVVRVGEKARLRRENERLRSRSAGSGGLDTMGRSQTMVELARKVELLAESDRTTVLLLGESGTGKGWVAQRIHQMGPRAHRSFVEVNSAGLTGTFLISELFGHEQGTFTDAREGRDGLLVEADGGTLFLDEIGDLSAEVQPRLLKVLETRTFRRLGGSRDLQADVRLIAATHRDLRKEVESGRFREDLFYRLNVAPIHLPPLRERSSEDRLYLLHHLFRELNAEIPGSPGELSEDALDRLVAYGWPGNIREMRNVLERALIFGRGAEEIRVEHLPRELVEMEGPMPEGGFRPRSLEEMERAHIIRMLLHHDGNRTRAARDLGIARTTLIQKIRRYEIPH